MPVGESEEGECPVDTRPGEREIHGWISPVVQAEQECAAQNARRARKMRAGVLESTLSPFSEAQRHRPGYDSRDGGGRVASGTATEILGRSRELVRNAG